MLLFDDEVLDILFSVGVDWATLLGMPFLVAARMSLKDDLLRPDRVSCDRRGTVPNVAFDPEVGFTAPTKLRELLEGA